FGVAYLIKESVRALETRDVEQMKQAMRRMGTGRFWMDLGVFSAASGGVQATLGSIPMSGVFRPFFFRTALPLATGMAAVQAMSGHFSVVDLAIDGSSFLVAGLAVQHVADGAMFLLRGATPTGIVYGIGKLAATLYLGEKLGDELRRRMRRDAVHRIGSDGVSQKLEVLSN
ncbi:MAG: hypothetical protein HYY16_19975, partial [Planctomycetes bacterium]|nr:hypothetical protein [Planctomycetota bacterium]